jgi:hypothetical protein
MYDEDELGTDDWKSHELDGRSMEVFTEWTKERIEEIKRSSKEDQRCTIPGTEFQRFNLIIFDDYNNEINTHVNTDYKDLFTRGRHNNLRVMNLVHHSTAIAPIARKQCKFNMVLAATIDRGELKELAKCCYRGPENMFIKSIDSIRDKNRYSSMFVDKSDTRIAAITADYKKVKDRDARVDELVAKQTGRTLAAADSEVEVALPPGSSLLETPGDAAFEGVADPFGGGDSNAQYVNPTMGGNMFGSIGQKNILNHGQFADNSKNVYNTQYKVNQQQMLDTQMINHQQRVMQMEYKMKEDLAARKYKCWELVNQENVTLGEMGYVLETVNMMLRPKTPYTRKTLARGVERWAGVYFEEFGRPGIARWAASARGGKEGIERMGNGVFMSSAKIMDGGNWSESIGEAVGAMKFGLLLKNE